MTSKARYLIICILALAMCSCRSSQNLGYFEDLKKNAEGNIPATVKPLTIMPEDELRIVVTSTEPSATAPFNLPIYNSMGSTETTSTSNTQMQTYVVDARGDIDFPVFGRIHVEGMTTLQLKEYLAGRISETVKDPTVNVSLVNFKVKVMGEVNEPQILEVKNERLTVLDALAGAGDLTEYAQRENVMVIRQEPDGRTSYGLINLRDSKSFESPYFVLQQNDVVYATPNKVKQDNSKYSQNNGFKLSVISTVVSSISVIASLVIALTR